jgi:iron complex outermembrane receptor protein
LGTANSATFYLRGISTGTLSFEVDSGIGLYINGVYLGRPSASSFDLADIERIEVLRGPQGTLFGRNSTGGAINFITAPPKGEFAVRGETTVGNYDTFNGRVTVDLPALGPLTARVTYIHNQNDGYVRNLTPGRTFDFAQPFGTIRSAKDFGRDNTDAIGVSLRLDLARLTVDYNFDYTDKNNTNFAQQLVGFNPGFAASVPVFYGPSSTFVGPTLKRQSAIALDFTSPTSLRVQGHSLTATYDLTEELSLKSLTAFRKFNEFTGGNDIDGGALTLAGLPFTVISGFQKRHQRQFSQEAQLIGKFDQFDFVLGAFYFRETGHDNGPLFLGTLFPPGTIQPSRGPGTGNTINLFGIPSDYFLGHDVRVRNRSTAGYAHAGWKGERIELAGGVRYTKDNRREDLLAAGLIPFAAPPTSYFASGDNWDLDATATYVFNRDVRTYARFATGYLSGGVLNGIPFAAETIDSYEVGIKGDFFDRHLRINASAFHTKRRNIQTLAFDAVAGTYLVSLPRGRENGVEIEATAIPFLGLTLSGSFGFVDQKLSENPLTGNPTPSLAPRYTGSAGIQYDFPQFGNDSYLSLRVDGFYKHKRFNSSVVLPETRDIVELPTRFDVNARLSLIDVPFGSVRGRIALFAQNLTNNKKMETVVDLTTAIIGTFQKPRTYGLELGIQF